MSTPPLSPGTSKMPGVDIISSVGEGGSTSQATEQSASQATVAAPSQATGALDLSKVAGSKTTSHAASVLRLHKRTKDELRDHEGLYDEDVVKDKYLTRGTKECMQWVANVTLGINSKFSTVKNDAVKDEQFESVYNLSMRIAELKTFLKQNGLLSSFDIYPIDPIGKPILPDPLNLMDDYATITLEAVKSSTRAIKEHQRAWYSNFDPWF